MSRYIDADAMKEWLDEYLSVFKKYDKREVKGFVEYQPSIDIVRCKECKYWTSDSMMMICGQTLMPKEDDDYCSWGEREDE